MARKYLQTERDVGMPPKVFLPDGREIRLVPPNLCKRPLYASKDGDVFTCFSYGFKQVKSHVLCVPRYPKKGQRQHKAEQLSAVYNGILVHHAVLSAWVGPRPEGMECDHINGDSLDNRLCNLEWVTHQENMHRRADMYHSKGLGFNGKRLTKEGKIAWRKHGKSARLVQMVINFEDEAED